jgi:glutamine synthetase
VVSYIYRSLTNKVRSLKFGIGHVHVSLRDQSGRNVFAVDKPRTDAKWDDLKHVSKELEWFLAGVLKALPSLMPCLVPTVNG